MKQKMTFYFDFTSPYSYLSFLRIDAGLLESRYNISYLPVMVGRLFSLNELTAPAQVENKALYLFKEALRTADLLGFQLTSPKSLPFNSLPYLRMVLGLEEKPDIQHQFILETFKYGWEFGHDYNDYDFFKKYITEKCLTNEQYNEIDGDRTLKKKLKTTINNAYEKGVFGVPTFEVNDDFYWGNHNLDLLANHDFLDYNMNEEFLNFKKFFENI